MIVKLEALGKLAKTAHVEGLKKSRKYSWESLQSRSIILNQHVAVYVLYCFIWILVAAWSDFLAAYID